MALVREGPEVFQHLVFALGLPGLPLGLRDPVALVDLGASAAGEGAVAHLLVLASPFPKRRALDAELLGSSRAVVSSDGTTFAAETSNRLP